MRLVVLCALLLAVFVDKTAQARPAVEADGMLIMGEREVLRIVGRAPRRAAALDAWTEKAAAKITRFYHRRGYLWARVWVSRTQAESKTPADAPPLNGATATAPIVRFLVDEGVMHEIHFVSAGLLGRLELRRAFELPHRVYHERSVKKALRALRREHGLSYVDAEVVESNSLHTVLGDTKARRRTLLVYTRAGARAEGLSFDAGVNTRWGTLIHVGLGLPRLGKDGRLRLGLTLAWPRRRLFDENTTKWRWVHGRFQTSWVSGSFADKALSLELMGLFDVSLNRREDAGYREYTGLHQWLGGTLWWHTGADWKLGLGLASSLQAHLLTVPETGGDATPTQIRGEGHLELRYATPAEDGVNGLLLEPTNLSLRGRIGVDGTGKLIGETKLTARLTAATAAVAFSTGISAHALLGDVRFWDRPSLAGPHQRASFGHRYWPRLAAQLEVAGEVRVGRSWLGLFADASVFEDHTDRDGLGLANAFGPSYRVIIWRTVAMNVHYAFGFSPSGFGHNFDVKVSTAF
jgi:hypothetical protein